MDRDGCIKLLAAAGQRVSLGSSSSALSVPRIHPPTTTFSASTAGARGDPARAAVDRTILYVNGGDRPVSETLDAALAAVGS
jgi:hypothetical protein